MREPRSGRAPAGSGDRQRRILRKEYLFAFRYGSKEYTEEEWRELEQSADAYAEIQLRRVICRGS